MNELPCIMIQKVANGYVVTIPFNAPNTWELQAAALKELTPGFDPSLQAKKQLGVLDELPTSQNVHIFENFELVLAFLAKKYV